MPRHFSKKRRNTGTRKQKPLIVIVAEGKNVTEYQYFKYFQDREAEYNIKVLRAGCDTDPVKLQQNIEHYWHRNELDKKKGDVAYIVLDLDCDNAKADIIERRSKKSNIAQYIVSNPCFEVWFLLHFKYTTHQYNDSAEVIRELRCYVEDYQKNKDIAPMIAEKMDFALQNTEQLQKHYTDLGYKWPCNDCNPRTDVPLIIKRLKGG